MEITNIELDIIDKYLRGELKDKELSDFNNKINSDNNFKKKYLFVKSLKQSIRTATLIEKKQLLQDYEKQIKTSKSKSPNSNLKRLFAFASVAAAFILLILFVPDMMENNNDDQIVLEYFESYPAHVLKRGSNQKGISKLKQKAYSLYGISEFKKASPLLAELCDSGDKESCFYTGIALLGSGKYDKAIAFFEIENLQVDENTIKWYTGLCYWNKKNKVKAKSFWKQIDKQSTYYSKYKEILKYEK